MSVSGYAKEGHVLQIKTPIQITNTQISTFGLTFCFWFLKKILMQCLIGHFFMQVYQTLSWEYILFWGENMEQWARSGRWQEEEEEKKEESRTWKTKHHVFFCLSTNLPGSAQFYIWVVKDPKAEVLNLCIIDMWVLVILFWGGGSCPVH